MVITYRFEWDNEKAVTNRRKHAVSFEEAATVFRDANSITIHDPDHGDNEDRWVTMGISETGRLLIVCHTFREEDVDMVIIRIISSRKANKRELHIYGER
ncbi:MAG: BrnT family toxin [bacterium]